MTQEEKLSKFYDISIENATARSDQMLSDCREALEAEFASHKSEKEAGVAGWMRAETVALRRQLTRELSDRQAEIRRKTVGRQIEVLEAIFANVYSKLQSFRKTPEYQTWLFRKVEEAKKFAGQDAVTVYVDPDDAAYADEIEASCGIAPAVSEYAFGGGLRAVIREKRILIDNSFDTLAQEAKDNFRF
ncbi:MAG: V-type ATP synthase subunit E [Lachnospiraceae bacterium]|nr:V-type ATP synthase subunit E [Lachnospiraceae bacterium]